GAQESESTTTDPSVPVTVLPAQSLVLADGTASSLAASATRTFFESAPVAVLAAPGEELRGASAAVALGVPVLLDGPEAATELDRLGVAVVLGIGPIADPGVAVVLPSGDAELAEAVGADPTPTPVPV